MSGGPGGGSPDCAARAGYLVPDVCSKFMPPLTTTFHPPSTCQKYATFTLAPEGIDNLVSTNTFELSVIQGVSTGCYPPGFYATQGTTALNANTTMVLASTYSPGVCPSAWSPVVQNLQSGTTVATCCPPYVVPQCRTSLRLTRTEH